MDRDPFDLVGDVLDGQFRVDAFAGEGDLSVVYKGHHLGVDAPVAIKCLNLPETLDPALARPLVDGFKEASRVHYRLARGNLHIAQTIASGATLVPRSGAVVPYLVREWFEGESLASNLAQRRAERRAGRTVDEALALLESAFDGVAHAHAQGEMHLSINPSNLFVVGGEGTAAPPSLKVLDFGVARTMNAIGTGTAPGAKPGAGLRLLFPAYAAPEQLDRTVGALGPWTDVYALALVMLEVLSDRIVMGEIETGAVVEHALDEHRRPTAQSLGLKLPSHVERALARAVALAPARRQKNAAELWKDVKNTVRSASRSMAAAALPAAASVAPRTPTRPPIAYPSQTPTPLPSQVPGALASPAPAPLPSRGPAAMPSRMPTPLPGPALSRTPGAMPSRVPTPMPSRLPASLPSRAPFPSSLSVPSAAGPARIPTLGPARMPSATLVGLSPPVIPPVAADVPGAHPRTLPIPSVTTRPMSFELPAAPPAVAEPPLSWNFDDLPTLGSLPAGASSPSPPEDRQFFEEPPHPVRMLATRPEPLPTDAPALPPPAIPGEAVGSGRLESMAAGPVGPQPSLDGAIEGNALAEASFAQSRYGGATDPAPAYSPADDGRACAQTGDGAWPADASSPTFPSTSPIDRPPIRRSTGPLAQIVTPRSTPVLLAIAGGAFWTWAFGIMVWLCTLPLRHAAEVSAPTPSATATSWAASRSPARPLDGTTPTALAPAPTPALARAPTPAQSPAPAPSPAPDPANPGSPPFHAAAAIHSLDSKWRDVAKCRRGKLWGKAATTVTFAGDGSVTHIDVGPPFTDTPTADCIADALSAVRIEPFGDKTAALPYRVYVAPR